MKRLTKLIYTGMMNSPVTRVTNLTNQMDSLRMSLMSAVAGEQQHDKCNRVEAKELATQDDTMYDEQALSVNNVQNHVRVEGDEISN